MCVEKTMANAFALGMGLPILTDWESEKTLYETINYSLTLLT